VIANAVAKKPPSAAKNQLLSAANLLPNVAAKAVSLCSVVVNAVAKPLLSAAKPLLLAKLLLLLVVVAKPLLLAAAAPLALPPRLL
jgi:hypothetical protein